MARSTFGSKNAKNTSVSDHFWKLRCLKSARSCSAHHISKSKRAKHISSWQGEMSKKCTPLWREAHFEVKMVKAPHVWTFVAGTMDSAPCQKEAKREGLATVSKTMAGVVKRTCTDACRVAGAKQRTCLNQRC